MKNRSLFHIAAYWLFFGLLVGGMIGLALNTGPVKAASLGRSGISSGSTLQEQSDSIPGTPVTPVAAAVIDFNELAHQAASLPQNSSPSAGSVVPFMPGPERVFPDGASPVRSPATSPAAPEVASPAPTLDYMGLDDIPAVGTGYSYIPPDTGGAVGPDRVFVTLNSNYRVQEKVDGTVVNTLAMSTFWNPTGASSPFDPKTAYDPYNQRFIVTGVSNRSSSTSSVLVGISNSSDPNGTWSLYRYEICSIVSCGGGGTAWWADYPTLGFNKNWIAISVNMFGNTSNLFQESRILVMDYPSLLSGTLTTYVFDGINDFTVHPVVTYDPNLETLYGVNFYGVNGSGYGYYRTYAFTSTPAGPSLAAGSVKLYTSLPAFSFFSGDLLPQDSEPDTDLIQNISAGDTRIMNAVYRNGYLWFAHAVAMPAGSYTHTAARWVKADTSGNFVDGGQVEDPTATAVNDGKWYAFPSIAVNRYNDVLLGFSQFSSAQWASAGYAFHDRNDLPGSMRDPYIYKAGEGFYYKIYGGTSNRWGDFSNSQVDPVDDTDLWTIQEYAKPQNGTGVNSGVWSTWWANLALPGLYTSIGTGGNWSVASTWDLNAVPQATDDVVIAAGTTVTVDSNAQCRQLTIEQGGTLVIPTGVNLIVSQSVTNHGTLTMQRNVNNASVPFQITDGGSTVLYRLLDLTTANQLDTVMVSVRALNSGEFCTSAGASSPVYAGRCFEISATNNQGANVRLWVLTSELGGVTTPAVFRFTGSWTELTGNAATGTDGNYTYASADTPGFSSFLIGQSDNIPTAVRLQDLGAGSDPLLGLLWPGFVALVAVLGLAAVVLVLHKRRDQSGYQ